MIPRLFKYQKSQSFFLFGPRGSGKSTWLKSEFKHSLYIDLLDEALYQDLLRDPSLFKKLLNTAEHNQWIIIDEIQRIPGLLNYIHQSIQEKQQKFIITGSSARKIKREEANLLAGRAIQRKFNPFCAAELKNKFDLKKALTYGQLPAIQSQEDPKNFLKSYVGTYLREEVQQESLVRNLSTFAQFLEAMTFSQAQILSIQTIATDIGVDRKTADSYIKILEDLLIAHRLPVFQKRAKRKVITKPKFYYFDIGVFRILRKGGPLDPMEELEGASIETLVFQELRAWIDNYNLDLDMFFHRTDTKQEVDFVLYGEHGFFAIEVQRSYKIRKNDLKSLELFAQEYPEAKCYLFCLCDRYLKTDSGIEIYPLGEALLKLDTLLNITNTKQT